MPADDTYKNYLRDLGYLVREYASEAKLKQDQGRGTDGQDFADGYLMGFHRIATLMEQQAEAFGIPLEDLAFEGFRPNDTLL